jgi:predicted ferric reductase
MRGWSRWVDLAGAPAPPPRRHRLVGFTSFWLMWVHIVLVTLGYAQAAQVNPLIQGWQLITEYGGMLLAAAGTIALVAVVITSIRRARRRLRYATWHLIHLYGYLGVGLALPHQLWTGQDFSASTLATVYWWTLWAVAAITIVCFRVVLPTVWSIRHRLVVREIITEANGIFSIVMNGRNLHVSSMQAGQYCQWRFLTGRGWSRPQPFSLSAAPTFDTLRITVQRIGHGTERLATLPPGTKVHFEGPYGTMTADRRTRRDVLLIGAGVGITPMRGLAQQISGEHTPGPRPSIVVLHRVHALGEAAFAGEFRELQRSARLLVVPLIGPRATGGSWLPGPSLVDPLVALERFVPDFRAREVYVCGPPAWAAAVLKTMRAAGLPKRVVHLEDFAT